MKIKITLNRQGCCAAFTAIGLLTHSGNADAEGNPSTEPVVKANDSTSDSKEPKAIVLQQPAEKWWTFTFETGYQTTYIFRGTNLTPNSDGLQYEKISFFAKGFTLGAWFGTQLGTAEAGPGVRALGEQGGGGLLLPPNPFGKTQFFAIQDRFRELDLLSFYSHAFGPVNVTFGNIAFFITRHQISEVISTSRFLGNKVILLAAPGDEIFDRIFLTLSDNSLHWGRCFITPSVTYYQTVYESQSGPTADYLLKNLYFLPNEQLGGYLEAKLQAVIPIIDDTLRLEPTTLISYSFKDRSEGVNVPQELHGIESTSRPLTGFNHVQLGADLVWQITKHFSLSGFGYYSHHLSEPTGGTERDEIWGGARATISF